MTSFSHQDSRRRIDVQALALDKLDRVLGPVRARVLLTTFLARHPGERLESAEDLDAFGRDLAGYGGTEETIGAQLVREAAQLETVAIEPRLSEPGERA